MFARIGRYVRGGFGALKAVAGSAGGSVTTFFRRCGEPMQADHLPELDARYWLAILLASVLGTVFGDYAADALGLGFISGPVVMGAVFLASLYAERVAKRFNEGFYWTAVVVTRAAATNLADLMTHQLHLDYGSVGHWLGLALVLVALWPGRAATKDARSLPTVDSRYWVGILIASVFGTVMGDHFSHMWGVGTAAGVLLTILGIAFYIKARARLTMEPFYWLAIAIERTAGTSTGDWFAGKHGLNLGTGTMSIVTAIVMTLFLLSFSRGKFVGLTRLRQLFAAKRQPEAGFDQRFWLFAVLAAAGGHEFMQWCYTYLSVPASTAIVDAINPYLFGFKLNNSWMYHSWLWPAVLTGFGVNLLASKWIKSKTGQGFFYWTGLWCAAAMGAGVAMLVRFAFNNNLYQHPSVLWTVLFSPVLLYLASTSVRGKTRRFAERVVQKGVSLGHCGVLFIAFLLGTSLGQEVGLFIAGGYWVDTAVFAAALCVLLHYRSRRKQVDSWRHEVVTLFACVMTAVVGYNLGDLLEGVYISHVGLAAQNAEWWAALTLPLSIVLIARFWREGTPWQAIVGVAQAMAINVVRWAIAYRRMFAGLAIVGGGLALVYFGEQVATLRSPQETLYKQGLASLNSDLKKAQDWSGFVHPEEELFQQSLMQFEHQREAGLIGRLLYGEPDVALASQANLKIGVILLYNAKDDKKLLNEAIMYLKLAIKMNPGVPYAHDLLDHIHGSTAEVDRLALMALAGERDLEMLYKHNPQQRSKQPQKSKEGKGDDGKEQGDQQGQPDQPNDQEAKPNDQKNDKEGQASKNTTLQQNMQDVKNGKANDGI